MFISHFVAQYQILAPYINTFYRPLTPSLVLTPLGIWGI